MTSFFLLLTMAAAEPKKCSDLGKTYCAFLEENKDTPVLKCSDGSLMVNPAHYKAFGAAPTPREFTGQENVRKTMQKLESPSVPLGLYMDLSSQLRQIAKPAVPFLKVAWPPSAEGPARNVPKKEVFDWLREKVGSERVDAFLTEVQKQSANVESAGSGDAVAAERDLVLGVLRDPSALAEKTEQTKKTFELARQSNIDVVTRGEGDRSKWTDEQKNLVERMKGLTPKLVTKEPLLSQYCASLENAATSVSDQTVYICPGLLIAATCRKAQVFGHEIGHAIDACAVQSEFAKFDVTKTLAYADAHFEPENAATLHQWFEDGGQHYDHNFESISNEPNMFERLTAAGALTTEQPRFNEMPTTYRAALKCAEEEYHLRFDTPADRANQVRDWGDHLASFSSLDDEARSKLVARADQLNRRFSNCKILPGPENQITETNADVFGMISKDKCLAANPPRTELDKMLSFNSNRVCEFSTLLPTDRLRDTMGLAATVSAAGERFRVAKDDAHPSDVKRIAIEADSPALARLYGCERSGRHCFDALGDPKKYGQSVNAESGAER